jgi:phosphoglycolate phosphatase-like HAD superfamily hydrolase
MSDAPSRRPAAVLLPGAREHADGWTTSAGVERTEPALEASERVGVPGVGVLTGGFSEQELRDAGAACVVRELRELLDDLEAPPFGSA